MQSAGVSFRIFAALADPRRIVIARLRNHSCGDLVWVARFATSPCGSIGRNHGRFLEQNPMPRSKALDQTVGKGRCGSDMTLANHVLKATMSRRASSSGAQAK